MSALTFVGCDTGLEGAFASLTFDPAASLVLTVRLAVMPTRTRDEGGREILTLATVDALRTVAPNGWARCLIERPVRGGMGPQGRGVEFAQGDAHGVARAVLDLEAHRLSCPVPEPAFVGGGKGWHAQLDMQSAREAGVNRKTLSINVAENLLAHLHSQGATVHGLAPCRGYSGLLGGQQDPRSGAADALLLAWLGLRMWLGVRSGAPTNSLDPAWRPEPKVKSPRVRKPPHIPPAATPESQG